MWYYIVDTLFEVIVMTEFLNALKSYIILSLSDLTHIKDTISRRYGHMTSTERAEILSMAVHNHLNKHLEGIDDANKESLKLSILSQTLAKHQYTISRLTVFDAILDLNLDDPIKTDLAESWLTESAQLSIPRWIVEDYMTLKQTSIDYVEAINEPTYYDDSDRYDIKKTPISIVVIAFALLLLIVATPTYFFLKGAFQPSDIHNIAFTTQLDLKDYYGLSTTGGIYLINRIDGYESEEHVYLTLEKKRFDFGLMKKADAFRFEGFNYFAVKHYILNTRNGLIGLSEQFNQIIHEAYLNDIDPLLLFAIIGQEQGFVSDLSSDSTKILNNPYNVYHSWVEYNTTLRDSTQIAINTIKNRLNKAPFSASAFKWLNMTYAEDINWHNGVSQIYAHLVSIGRPPSIQ
jgi:putative ABC transport system permease protein